VLPVGRIKQFLPIGIALLNVAVSVDDS